MTGLLIVLDHHDPALAFGCVDHLVLVAKVASVVFKWGL